MSIKAKFRGTCRKCGGSIAVGDTIEWEKGRGSSHINCASKPDQLLNSAAPPDHISPDADLVALAAQHGHQLAGEPRLRSYSLTVNRGEHCVNPGQTFEASEGTMLVLSRTRPQYWSEEDREDMDFFGQPSGLYYSVQAVHVEDSQQRKDSLRKQQEAQQEKEWKAAEQKARDEAWDRQRSELTAGLVRITASRDDFVAVGLDATAGDTVADWSRGDSYASLAPLACGGFAHPHGGYDDYRYDYFLSPENAKLIAAHRAEEFIQHGGTLERAQQYAGCYAYEPEFVDAVSQLVS